MFSDKPLAMNLAQAIEMRDACRENGVQHIFVYCGKYATPSGIFRISRTMASAVVMLF